LDAILVLGGAGYVGSHACKALARAGFLPVTIDSVRTGHAEAVKWGPLIEADFGDVEAVRAAVRNHGVSAAMHFAAMSLVAESVVEPALYAHGAVAFLLGQQGVGPAVDAGIALDLGVLCLFKYADFLAHIVSPALPSLGIPLPLAISFFSFQQIMFLVEAWRHPERDTDRRPRR